MAKVSLPANMKNLKKNFLLLLSAAAFLCLFLAPSLTALLIVIAMFGAVAFAALRNHAKPPALPNHIARLAAVLIAVLIALISYDTFKTTWTPSRKVAALANELHLTTPTLLLIVGLVGCAVGFYAMYTLSCWSVIWGTQVLKKRLPEQRKLEIVANLKRNWYFLISAMAFFCLNATLTLRHFVALLIAFMTSLVIASQISSLFHVAKQNRIWTHIVAIMTALGVCWNSQTFFCSVWRVSSKAQALEAMFPISIDIPGVISVLGAVAALFFVYFCVLVFWKEMTRIISDNGLFRDVNISEQIVYGILIIASAVLMVRSFAQTDAFYGTKYPYDIIYTSDSSSLVRGNVYLALTHSQNDLRQPLFAVFAAPFVGIPYLLGKLFGASASAQAMLIDIVQVIMLFAANFMLAKMMKLDPIRRVCFMLLASCTYTHLLSILMIEQYIVAYFWLIFCIYLISKNQRPDRIALWGAGGTLLTGLVLLPFMSDKNPVRDFRAWFADMLRFGLEFVAVMLAFCRLDVIFSFTSKISSLADFTGKNLIFVDKFYQYIAFISNCFVAPDAGVHATAVSPISWQLNPVTSMNLIGIAILLFAVVSAIVNRNKKSSLLAAGWIAFSVVLLLGLGWGTAENGLVLYVLYFGWAFLVLLFQLVEKIEEKLNVKFLTPVLSIGSAAALAAVNIPAIMEMVDFAIAYFPA